MKVEDKTGSERATDATRVFLLSPAYCGGRRAKMLLGPKSTSPLARQLAEGTLSLGDAFSFMSGLYFRGKLSYARAFGRQVQAPVAAIWIITPTRGLQPPEAPVTRETIREFATVDVSADDPRYRTRLERDVERLAGRLPRETRVVLLGSIASGKYVDVLAPLLGERLCYPASFIGRGDMSRGGLLLRCATSGVELEYAVLEAGVRPRGQRPPKLEPLRR
jgi:hypothetical protein